MHEDPYTIRLNIQHYQELLKQPCAPERRQQILRLLARAQAELPHAAAQAEAERGGGLERFPV